MGSVKKLAFLSSKVYPHRESNIQSLLTRMRRAQRVIATVSFLSGMVSVNDLFSIVDTGAH